MSIRKQSYISERQKNGLRNERNQKNPGTQ